MTHYPSRTATTTITGAATTVVAKVAAIVVATVAAWALVACGESAAPSNETAAGLPALELEMLDGTTLDTTETGTPRVLNLWATWCAPCRHELPAFDQVAAVTDSVDIIGINVGDSGPEASELLGELGVSFPQALDPTAQIQRRLMINNLPATVFVGADGSVLDIRLGALDAAELTDRLADLFGVQLEGQ